MATITDRRRVSPDLDVDSEPPPPETEPILNNHRDRPRRLVGKNGLRHRPARQRSLTRDIGHVAAETYLITRLTFTLLQYLGIGYRWISRSLALGCYAMLLMPGFLQVAYYYYFTSKVKRSIVYGDQPRNRLDLYLPADTSKPKPVLIFVTGGAWIIGYKAWGSLLGLQLAERDIIVACIDYRNFPQGTISDMVTDVCQGISFVINNIANYGGDPNRIYLMGQSAGAHISSCALLDQAIREAGKDRVSWSVSQIKTYFGLSGGYNLLELVDHFHNRGLYRSIFLSIMEGEESLKRFSPEIKIQDPRIKLSIPLLPPIVLFHGTADYSIPSVASERFAEALKKAGASAELILYDGKTHTDLFLQEQHLQVMNISGAETHACFMLDHTIEGNYDNLKDYSFLNIVLPKDPLRGGKDDLFDHVVAVIHSNENDALGKGTTAPPRRRFVPEILLKLARKISPF